MKKLLYLIIPFLLLSCDDGDLIVEDLDFNGLAIELCEIEDINDNSDYLFFIVDGNDNETISLSLNTNEPILTRSGVYGIYSLNSNVLEYRKLNGSPGTDYYCNDVPPSSPTVSQIYLGEAGDVIITSLIIEDDNDGIDAIDEGINLADLSLSLDTDGDGIPDYKDSDDDNDNVMTIDELDDTDISIVVDTDGDTIPNYLDNDDDGDGILTIQEDIDRDFDPTDDLIGTIPNYLNALATQTANPPISSYNENIYEYTGTLDIVIENLTATSGSEEIIIASYNFGTYIRNATVTERPTF